VILVSAVGGGCAGAVIRQLLGRLRRGLSLRAGPAEIAAALITGFGVAVTWAAPTVGLVLFAGLLLVALSAVDIVHHRLPDAITLPALPIAAVAVGITYLLAPASGSPLRAVLSAAVLWAVFAGIARISASWMGRGDVKLIPVLGLLMGYLSVGAVVVGLALAFALGSAVALIGMALGRLRLKSRIPLGPYLLAGCWVVLLFPA
jgi:leader peptidase (prepilin peptidase) / N-methyltransferase